MKYIIFCFSTFFILSFSIPIEDKVTDGHDIQWMTWSEAVIANKQSKRKILVDVYTDWCGWCKVMDTKTFTDNRVVNYVNKHFYAVKLNAEQKQSITWDGHEFRWVEQGRNGVHTLAYALLNGEMSFPSCVFLDENHDRIRISKGFRDAEDFMEELKFAAEERYLAASLPEMPE